MARRAEVPVRLTPGMLVERHGLIELGPLAQLAGNPHRADRVALRKSIEAFGQFESIVVWRGEVLIGNNRVEEFAAAGETHLAGYDLSDLELDEAKRWAIALASNRTAQLGSDDPELLAAALSRLDVGLADSAGFDLSALPRGVDEAFAALRGGMLDGADPDDHDPVPPSKRRTVSRSGDVWTLGPHRLVCGEARDPAVWGVLFEVGPAARLLVSDPPYGVSYVEGLRGGKHRAIVNDGLPVAEVRELWTDSWGCARPHMLPGASFYVTGPTSGDLREAFYGSFADAGLDVRHTLIWIKDRFVLGRSDYHYQHEPILFGQISTVEADAEEFVDYVPVAYGWAPDGSHLWRGGRNKSTVWEIPRPASSADHPTMKPVELYGRCVRNSSTPGDAVVDPFAGSGTLLAACVVEHRLARMVELDPGYCDVIARRYQKLTGDVPVRNGSPHRFKLG